MITPELALKIIFLVVALVTAFYGIVHITFYKLGLPGFKKWALHLGFTLLVISAVLLTLSFMF